MPRHPVARTDGKTCPECREFKPFDQFYKNRAKADGMHSSCIPCFLEFRARDIMNAKNRELKRKYGISIWTFMGMYLEQRGECAICHEYRPALFHGTDGMCVDHCHKTGEVRGLLCNGCNGFIGLSRHNKSALLSAAEYLHQFSNNEVSP